MPDNFLFILIGQIIALLAVMRLRRGEALSFGELLISAIAGGIIGLAFDLTLGSRNIFVYVTEGVLTSVYGLTVPQLVVNGILSYGISVATARYLPLPDVAPSRAFHATATGISGAALLLSTFAAYYSPSSSIAAMFAYGILIVAVGELLALLAGIYGPFWRMLAAPAVRPLITIWAWITGIGVVYELVNATFPFWRWLPSAAYDVWHVEVLVVLFGYIVLFHPMMVVWQLVDRWKRR